MNARNWSPHSWRALPCAQMPDYADQVALATTESCLAAAAPLTRFADCLRLRTALAEVADNRGFLLQGGDCAETFAEFGADKVRLTFNLLLEIAAGLRAGGAGKVVKVARIAGQFAKPRSTEVESIGDVSLPVYRGDIVNGAEFTPESRAADPVRMLEAHRQARVTLDLVEAYSSAAYADLSEIHRRARQRVGLVFDHAQPPGDLARPVAMFTSHEALLLPYEQALTRHDEATARWWAGSAHLLWIGNRTRQLDGAHVEYARGIANPIALKCGPDLEADGLLRLVDRLDPGNDAGRLVLIGRFGASEARRCLSTLMRATRRAGSKAIWAIDPMHGNTRIVAGRKTRLVADIIDEIGTFFAVARAEGVHPGGVHLELTGAQVTECLGGSAALAEADLGSAYLTHCDPRLNRTQAIDVAASVAAMIKEGTPAASDAA